MQSAEASLNAAEMQPAALAPLDYLASNLQTLVSDAKDLLPDDDPRLVRLTGLARESAKDGFTEQERTTVVAAIEAAKKASLRNQFRLRSFRNVVMIATLLASTLALSWPSSGSRTRRARCRSATATRLGRTISARRPGPPAGGLLLIGLRVLGRRCPRVPPCAMSRAARPYSICRWRSRC